MTIELLPQHDEEGRAPGRDGLVAPTSLSATDEGLMFTRLLTRLVVRSSDTAFVLVGVSPGADILAMAMRAVEEEGASGGRAITDGEAGAVGGPGVGQVVRQPTDAGAPDVGYETVSPGAGSGGWGETTAMGPAGPAGARAPTLGEAMLSPPVWVKKKGADGKEEDARTERETHRRQVVALVVRLPERAGLMP
jgi:hypothetical protein